jgi:hypothetical protein
MHVRSGYCQRELVVDCVTIPFPLSEALESLIGWFLHLGKCLRRN